MVLSSSTVSRVLRPAVVLELTLADGQVLCFEASVWNLLACVSAQASARRRTHASSTRCDSPLLRHCTRLLRLLGHDERRHYTCERE